MNTTLQETQFFVAVFLFIASTLYMMYLIQELPNVLQAQVAYRTLPLQLAQDRPRRIGTAVIDKAGPSLRLGPRILAQIRYAGPQTTEELLEALQARDPYVGMTSLMEEMERLFTRGRVRQIWVPDEEARWIA